MVFHRGDIPGALSIALSDAPYGPDVDDAKVHTVHAISCLPQLADDLVSACSHLEPYAADRGFRVEQHEGDGDIERREGAVSRVAGPADEVSVQGHGDARMGRLKQ